METDQFYEFWEKFSRSEIAESVPEDVVKFCEEHNISIDYFIAEFV